MPLSPLDDSMLNAPKVQLTTRQDAGVVKGSLQIQEKKARQTVDWAKTRNSYSFTHENTLKTGSNALLPRLQISHWV